MDKLPLPAVISIIEFGITGPHRQPSLLRVCSDFYLAAIPALYHSPHITSGLDSFFLHTTTDVPDDYQSLSSRELLQAGHSKLAALRYLRHLTVAPPGIDPPPMEDLLLSIVDEAAISMCAQSRLADHQIDDAVTYIKSLPPFLLLGLETIQIGDIRQYHSSQMGGIGWNPGWQDGAVHLLQQSRPRAWCHHRSAVMPFTFPSSTYAFPIDSEPIDVYNHTHMDTIEILLVAGGTTYIYIYPGPDYPANGATYPSAAQVSQWLAVAIHDVWGEHELETQKAYMDLIRKSRIILCFAAPSLVNHDDPAKESDDGSGQIRLVEEGIRSRLSKYQTRPYLGDIVIEGRIATDMPDCPACGMGAGGL